MNSWLRLVGVLAAVGMVIVMVYAALTSPLVLALARAMMAAAAVVGIVVAIGAVILVGYYVAFRLKRWQIRVVDETSRSVQFFGSNGMVYAVNPGGVPIQALHLDSRSYVLPEPDEPDEFNAAKWAMFNAAPPAPRRGERGRAWDMVDAGASAALPPVLPQIVGDQRLLVTGGMGTGKSNLLCWIAAEKRAASRVLVIDTHAAPGQWPVEPGAVLGRGRNWAGVETALEQLLRVMDKRYREIDRGIVGPRGHMPITLIADEWTMIPQMLGEEAIKRFTWPVLVESRKASIDFVLATHDTTVAALGIKGAAGLKNGFDWIVETQKREGQYVCLLRRPGQRPSEAVVYAAPPLYQKSIGAGADPLSPPGPPKGGERAESPMPSQDEAAILAAYAEAREAAGREPPLKWVCERLGWQPGGMQYEKIRSVVNNYTDVAL